MKVKIDQIEPLSSSVPAAYALYFAQEQYVEAVAACEQAIEQDPTEVSHYCYLGLALLLQGQETEAQIVWMAPILDAEPEQSEQYTTKLVQVIQTEAVQQEAQSAYKTAWLLRQHLREIAPEHLENLLRLLKLELRTQTFSYASELLQTISQLLQEYLQQPDSASQPFNSIELQSIIQQFLKTDLEHVAAFEFLNACIPHLSSKQQSELSYDLLEAAYACHSTSRYAPAVHLAKLCAELSPGNIEILMQVISLMQSGDTDSLLASIPLIGQVLRTTTDLIDRIAATHSMLTSLMMTCSSWQTTHQYYQIHKALLNEIQPAASGLSESPEINGNALYRLLGTGMFLFYFEDEPAINRLIRNQIAQAAQDNYQLLMHHQIKKYPVRAVSLNAKKTLKIGYFSECLRVHSVGWLVRWLLNHHDRNQFEIHLYSTKQSNDFLQQSFISNYRERFHHLTAVPAEIADRIYQDEIDILVDLDSMTSFVNCAVTALKPAPIQVSWLGYDASGLPTIDYYIADPYVLPENAQEYYSEKIWRLPQTYIAVNGFEVGVPNLRRDQLNIPDDAIVYLSSQTGLKRNPDNVRLQFQILKHVPNSYFLIKSFNSDPERLQEFFLQLAEEEGINGDRLRFLPDFAENSTYRANLRLADIILDTYPYNGATTTLEALWMGLPIVTRVGQQFAARNSYTMLMNVGISEGIAWTDEEYVNWGIRLGEDATLRCDITYRLRQSRNTSPLWNTQKFAKEMENAYEQMWKLR